ncbi:MAG: hypothetical protein U0Z53_20180 [Blastocatellia bacterium]
MTVSAASYEGAAIAPDSIVAAFGTQLATQTSVATALPLPTELGGTTVEVNGRRAGLFFVSPFQVNYLVPAETETGNANVVVRSGNGTISNGTLQVRDVAPAIFTANSDGQGVPAAFLLRVRDTSQQAEEVAQCVGSPRVCTARAFDLGPESERVFLILFLSGIRRAPDPNGDGNLNENVHVVIGGNEIIPAYAGPQGTFVGLNQINVEIPRSLIGRGRVNVSVAGDGFIASNPAEIEIGARPGSAPPVISGFGPAPTLAGQMLTLNGAGLLASPAELLVRVAGVESRILSVSASQLSVQVPFGARSGLLSVRTPNGEGASTDPLAVRTSVSGVIENTDRQPVSGVNVKVSGTSITARTGAEGTFILPDVAPGPAVVEVDGTTIPVSPPFPKVILKTIVRADQDNQFTRPISLQQNTGATIPVGGNSLTETVARVPVPAEASAPADRIQSGNVSFEVPANTTVRFPDGTTRGILTLTLVANSRTPVNLPPGIFSSVIAQISPFGAALNPGGKLTFPNPDSYPAGSQLTLFRLDQTASSSTLGSFIEAGTATVTADGQRIETAADAVKETSYYFVAQAQATTTVTGRVTDADGRTPVRLAVVRVRGQETFTDGDGGFVLRNIPVRAANDKLTVEASYVRPSERVDRVQRDGVVVVVGGVTVVTPDLALPGESANRQPVIIAPLDLTVSAGDTFDFTFTASDPDGQTVQVEVTKPDFASSPVRGSNDSYTMRLSPRVGLTGNFEIVITSRDDQTITTHKVSVRVSPALLSCGSLRAGAISAAAQVDQLTFSGQASERVTLTLTASGFPLGATATATIISPTAPPVSFNANSQQQLTLSESGVYVIQIRASNLVSTGSYSIGQECLLPTSPVDATLTCGALLPDRPINAAGQVDQLTFSGQANDQVTLTLTASGFPLGATATARVFSPTATLLISFNANSQQQLTLPTTGTYIIQVQASNLVSTGSYNLGRECLLPASPVDATLTCGALLSDRPINASAQVDQITFSGQANERKTLTLTASGFPLGATATATVFSPTAKTVISFNANSQQQLTLSESGVYVIQIRASNLVSTGSYSIGQECLLPISPVDATLACGTLLSDRPINAAGQVDQVTFSGQANERKVVTLTASGFPLGATATATIFPPTASPITFNANNQQPLTLPEGGTYVIQIRASNFVSTGTYSIGLQCLP